MSVMQLMPEGVVKAVSSPRGVELPPRRATWKSAPSAGGPASTHAIAVCTESPGPGAEIDAEVVFDDDDDAGARVIVVEALDPALWDGVIGVSSVGPGLPAGTVEQPATSTDVANTRAIRIGSG